MKRFCNTYGLRNLIRWPRCYKNSENFTCIDLLVTHIPLSFHSTSVLETGSSDFHLMTLTVMGLGYKIFELTIVSYRSCKFFSHENVRENLLYNLLKISLVYYAGGLQKFCDMGFDTLNKRASCKNKHGWTK